MGEREKLAAAIGDEDLVRYFYLDMDAEAVLGAFGAMRLRLVESQEDVPFNAAVKSYLGAVDQEGHPWIVKPIGGAEEALYHRLCTIPYLMDLETGTLAAQTTVFRIGRDLYRATKVVRKSVQISSYDYMACPFIDILRADLVNRWIYFDEDRNPNNYLVVTNKAGKPFVAAIDYDKADILSEDMKITGNPDKFGWFRNEKTRFLTLLRPDNFDGLSMDVFQERIAAMEALGTKRVRAWAAALAEGYCADPAAVADKVAANMERRIAYVASYFRSMFKEHCDTANVCHDDDYSMMGESFLAMHKRKK